ncbi:accessory gland protein Acp29AB-like [Drosophila nasuta]|uniref:accessory gland protein Acp29AB-like n=1 Tax=Drosophila nasuta TaxID=42062 RepID=UPI00295ED88C|nr:accessory gland protein Acp29AB-like [Drosophila nasuta]
MVGKLGILLLFSQLLHSGVPTKTVRQVASSFTYQIGHKFYHVESESTVTWFEAAHICREMGGNLLNIESSDEMDELLSIIPVDRYWISANCLAKKPRVHFYRDRRAYAIF